MVDGDGGGGERGSSGGGASREPSANPRSVGDVGGVCGDAVEPRDACRRPPPFI